MVIQILQLSIHKKHYINYPTFERISMESQSQNAKLIKTYFIKLRQFIYENQHIIYQSIEQKKLLKKFVSNESIYFFAVDEQHSNVFKIGRTYDIINRLRNYNVGKLYETDLKYYALVKNSLLIEICLYAITAIEYKNCKYVIVNS